MAMNFNKKSLTPNKVTLAQVLATSKMWYANMDNKKLRAKQDITKASVNGIKRFTYDRSTRKWKQTGRSFKLIFLVKTNSESYKRPDPGKVHTYPVTFVIHNLEDGVNTVFKWRTGSWFKPKLDGKNSFEINKKKMIQLQFFFELEYTLKVWGLLHGPCWANRTPRKTNPKLIPFFDKHAILVVNKIIVPFVNNPSRMIWAVKNK